MNILYFILGMLCYQVFIPIVDSIVTLVQTWIEVKKGVLSIKIHDMNKTLQAEEEECCANAIGFVYEPKEDFYQEDEEE